MGRKFLPRPNCAVCGKPCKTRGRTYCSKSCAFTGKPRPSARGNRWAYRGESAGKWAHYKRMQKLCPPGPCVECGSTEQSVIHHRDHDHTNTVPENLVRMCRPCHARHHHKRAA
jgi:5-methylcytosine-specific restriction endonuclease McrA